MKGGAKEYWFVLTAESLSWFKDDEVRSLVITSLRRVFYFSVFQPIVLDFCSLAAVLNKKGPRKSHCVQH